MPLPEQSPCTGVCQLNDHAICTGCYRTLDDIVHWRNYSEAARREAVAHSERRKSAAQRPGCALK